MTATEKSLLRFPRGLGHAVPLRVTGRCTRVCQEVEGLYCGCVGRTDKAESVGLELAGLNTFSGFWGTGHGDSFVVSTCCWMIRAGGQWPGM